MDVKDRVRALRKALGLTQETIAQRAGHGWIRSNVAKIENGHNRVTSHGVRVRLAQGFGLSERDLSAYIEGKLSLQDALGIAQDGVYTDTLPVLRDEPSQAESVLDHAIGSAFDPSRHFLRDLDAVRLAMRGAAKFESVLHEKLVEAASHWLDLAVVLRKRGVTVTTDALVLELTRELMAGPDSKTIRLPVAKSQH